MGDVINKIIVGSLATGAFLALVVPLVVWLGKWSLVFLFLPFIFFMVGDLVIGIWDDWKGSNYDN